MTLLERQKASGGTYQKVNKEWKGKIGRGKKKKKPPPRHHHTNSIEKRTGPSLSHTPTHDHSPATTQTHSRAQPIPFGIDGITHTSFLPPYAFPLGSHHPKFTSTEPAVSTIESKSPHL